MSGRMISVISQGNHKYSFCHSVLSTGQIAPFLIRPHKSVTSTTLGHWLTAFMKAAGIDSQIFIAHYVRGASMTAAAFLPFSNHHGCQWLIGLPFKLLGPSITNFCLTQTLLWAMGYRRGR